MQRKHFMFRRDDYAVSLRKGSIILCPLSETGQRNKFNSRHLRNIKINTFNQLKRINIQNIQLTNESEHKQINNQ
jgi:hypothetical protein